MGHLSAVDMKETGEEIGMSLETILSWHLSGNHYPPVSQLFIPVAIKAIELALDEDYDTLLDLAEIIGKPAGGFRKSKMTVSEVMNGLHLWDFLGPDNNVAWEDRQEADPRDPIPNEW